MNSKYEHYLQLFQSDVYDIPHKVYQKLEFLKLIISSSESMMKVDLENDFPDLEEQEIRALYNLNTIAQIGMFCSIMQSIEVENVDQNITGELHVKGDTLGLWKQKKFTLNLTAQTLSVPRQDNTITMLQLPLYQLKWLGEKRSGFTSYWAFSLEALNENNLNHYKVLVLGSDDKKYANKWFEYFKQVYKKNEYQQNNRNRRNTISNFRSVQQNNSGENKADVINAFKSFQESMNQKEQQKEDSKQEQEQKKEQEKIEQIKDLGIIEEKKDEKQEKKEQIQMKQQQKQEVIQEQKQEQEQEIDKKRDEFEQLKEKIENQDKDSEDSEDSEEESSKLISFKKLDQDEDNEEQDELHKLIRNSIPIVQQCILDININDLFMLDGYKQIGDNLYRNANNNNQYKAQQNLKNNIEIDVLSNYIYEKYSIFEWNHLVKDYNIVMESEGTDNLKWQIIQTTRQLYKQTRSYYYIQIMAKFDDKIFLIEKSIRSNVSTNDAYFHTIIVFQKLQNYNQMFISSYQNDFTFLQKISESNVKAFHNVYHALHLSNTIRQYLIPKKFVPIIIKSDNLTLLEKIGQEEEVKQESQSNKQTNFNQFPFIWNYKSPNQYYQDLLKWVEQNKQWDSIFLKDLPPIEDEKVQIDQLSDWIIDKKNNGLIFVNQQALQEQKKVFSYILSQMGNNLMQGKSVINISLPIKIFDKKSNLIRMAETYQYAPTIFEKRGNELEKLIAFYFSVQYLYIKLTKPFNPILGETYQGMINGCKIEIEQISHHPPICYLIFNGNGYKIIQRSESIANINVNSVKGQNLGWCKLQYDDGHTLIINNQNLFGLLGGNLFGDKLFQMDGELRCCDLQNNLVGIVEFKKNSMWSSERVFSGGIYETKDPEKTKNFMKIKEQDLHKLRFIHGSWYENLKVDNQDYWNNKMFAHKLIDDPYCLGSDSRFREDVLSWLMDDYNLAMEKKIKLEEIQRYDRKLRKGH